MKILVNEVRHFSPLSHWCREGKTLVVRPLKKHTKLLKAELETEGSGHCCNRMWSAPQGDYLSQTLNAS